MEINKMIDHTILSPDAREEEILQYCTEAKKYGFASVVVNSVNVPLIAKELKGSQVNIVAVVGFPLGAMLTEVKAFEASECVRHGADEIDMVINIGALKDCNYDIVEADIQKVVEASKPAKVKVIIETCLLTEEEKIIACQIIMSAGADYVKTSTGFSSGGARIEDIKLIKKAVPDKVKVKASGGIRSKADAMKFVAAGADRIGVGDGKLLTSV
jgi:deoxyribose-phosphate aldolase